MLPNLRIKTRVWQTHGATVVIASLHYLQIWSHFEQITLEVSKVYTP